MPAIKLPNPNGTINQQKFASTSCNPFLLLILTSNYRKTTKNKNSKHLQKSATVRHMYIGVHNLHSYVSVVRSFLAFRGLQNLVFVERKRIKHDMPVYSQTLFYHFQIVVILMSFPACKGTSLPSISTMRLLPTKCISLVKENSRIKCIFLVLLRKSDELIEIA